MQPPRFLMASERFTSTFGATLLLLSSVTYAACISRYDLLKPATDPPVFVLKSCSPGAKYAKAEVDAWKSSALAELPSAGQSTMYLSFVAAWDAALEGIQPDDQAVEVQPFNDSARIFMLDRDVEHWLFRGSCESLTLNHPVTLEVQQHCSDTGPTLVSLFGDMRIVKVLPK